MSDFKLIRQTLGETLERNALELGAQNAVIFGGSGPRWSWSELHHRTLATARGLLALGVRWGDHVAVWGTNHPEWLLTQLACGLIGAPLVTINPEWKVHEVEYALAQSDTRLLVLFPGFEKVSGNRRHRYDYPATLGQIIPGLDRFESRPIRSDRLPRLRRAVLVDRNVPPGFVAWDRLLQLGRRVPREVLEAARAVVTPDDIVLIQYTSGTTGFPKGAMLTHQGVLNNARSAARNLGLTPSDRICVTVPYYHCFGSIIVNLGSLVSGAATVVPGEHFDPHRTLATIAREQCTVLHGVPTMFISELETRDFEAHDLSSLRTGVMAGAPCPVELMEDVVRKMGIREITIGYGLTEASPLTHQTLAHDPLEKRTHTVGRPMPCTEARLVDPATLLPVEPGGVGEIWVRGYNVMKGYYRRPEDTAEAIRDGWLRTGDLGRVDPEGYYRIVGRLKEMIIVGGHNVYPAEVEQTILDLLGDRIEMAQVVGLPHPRLQEVVAVVIKLRDGAELSEEEVRLRLKNEMEWPKVPRQVLITEDFSEAMTATGKIQKFKLREILMRRQTARH